MLLIQHTYYTRLMNSIFTIILKFLFLSITYLLASLSTVVLYYNTAEAQENSTMHWGLSNVQEIWLANISNTSEDAEPVWLHYTDASIGYEWSISRSWSLNMYGSAFFTNGNSISELVGDLQGISNIEAHEGAEILEAWLELTSQTGLRLKGGILDSNADFDSIDPAQFFINSSHGIGPDFSTVGLSGPSIFPETGLGTIAFFEKEKWSVKLGAFDPLTRTSGSELNASSNVDWNRSDGVLIVSEVQVNTTASTISLGMWTSSFSLEKSYTELSNLSNAKGIYTSHSRSDTFGDTFIRLGLSDSKNAYIDRYIGAGWVKSISSNANFMPESFIGISWASARLGDLGIFSEFPRDQDNRTNQSFEHVLEISTSTKLSEIVQLQPNLQFIIQPGAQSSAQSRLVVGVRGVFEI